MSDVIRDVTIRAKVELLDQRIKTTALDEVFRKTKKLEEMGKRQVEISRTIGKEFDRTSDIIDRVQKDRLQLAIKTEDAFSKAAERQKQLTDESIKSADGFRTATDGAFALARGVALVSSKGEDLEDVVRRLAQLQAQFDLLRGSVDIARGGVDAFRNLGAGIQVARTAAVSLGAALGPGGAVFLGISALGVASGVLWNKFSSDAAEAARAAEEAFRRTQRLAAEQARTREVGRLATKLGAEVRTAADQLTLARAGGSVAERTAARANFVDVSLNAANRRERFVRDQLADPRLGPFDIASLSRDLFETRKTRAEVERQGILDEASALAPNARSQRDAAQKLIAERTRLLQDQRFTQDAFFDVAFTPSEAPRAAALSADLTAITKRLDEISEQRPDEKLAKASATLSRVIDGQAERLNRLNFEVESFGRLVEDYETRLDQLRNDGLTSGR